MGSIPLLARCLPLLQDTRANDGVRSAFLDEVKTLDDTLMKMIRKTRTAVGDVDGNEHTKKALVGDIARSEALRLRVQALLKYAMSASFA